MRKLLAILALILFPLTVLAQDLAELSEQVEDDRGFITRFLERNLSGAGRQIHIDGFRGALSSRATFDQLTIADDDGIWITLNDGAIQWNRSALLRGRVEVAELSAREILLPRLPGGAETERTVETREFALPELPVAVMIDQIEAERVEIGEPVIGIPAVVSLSGNMHLEGGEGGAVLNILRQDGPGGQFALDAAYSNSTQVLKVNLNLDEDPDGLLANLIDIYEKPAVHAEISGEGPLSDFTANISLATDGQPRVTGKVSATQKADEDGTPGTGFRLELGGDVASLLYPENRTFFGTNTQMLAEGWRGEDGRLQVPVLMIDTNAMNLSGSLTTTAEGAPQQAVLLMTLGADAGATELPVKLPFANGTTVQDGRLSLQYDAAQGSGWQLVGRIGQMVQPGLAIGAVELDGSGNVVMQGEKLDEITGQITFGGKDIAFDDPGMAQAVGDAITGRTNFSFAPDNAVELADLTIDGADYGLSGNLLMSGLSSGIVVSGWGDARYEDLSRLSTLSGRPVTGRADVELQGLYQVLTRAFDIEAGVTGTDISVDQKQIDRLLAGESRIDLAARRDETGIELSQFQLSAQRLTAEAAGTISSASSNLQAKISMPSLTDADQELGGSLEAEAFLSGAQGMRRLTVSGLAQDLKTGFEQIDGALQGATNLTVIAGEKDGGYVVEQFQLANPQIKAKGQGDFAAGKLNADIDLDLPDLSALGRGWSGALTAKAKATERDGIRFLDLTGQGQNLRLGQENVDGALTGVTNLTLSAEEQNGTITIRDLDLANDQMTVTAEGVFGEGVTDLTASADIRSLAPFGDGWRGSFRADGTLRDQGDGVRRLTVSGLGQDLALGQAQVDAALSGPTRLSVNATEQNGVFTIEQALVENPRLNATATGQLGGGTTDLRADLRADDLRFLGNGLAGAIAANAHVTDEGGVRRITAQGNARGLSVGQPRLDPLLAGNTAFDMAASQQDGAISIQRLNLQNPQVQLTADGSPQAGLNIDGRLVDLALVDPRFSGVATARGTVREEGQNFVVDLALAAPVTAVQIAGRAARDFSTTDLRITGTSDAAAANPFLRTRSIAGPLSFDLRMNGQPGLDALSGRVQLTNGELAEPRMGVSMAGLNVTADINGQRIVVDGGGNVSDGGRITIAGPVDLAAGTLDIAVVLDDVVLRDPNLFEATLRGNLRMSGVQADGPLISGNIAITEAEIRIPSTGLGGSKAIPDITHVGSQRPPVRATRAKAGLTPFPSEDAMAAGMSGPAATPPANPPRLDLVIDAPNRIFIRGRGVDAEMGGQMQIQGTTRNVMPIGTFELIRGRVDLLGKRFTLSEGLVELQGNMNPVIRLVAETDEGEITTRIIIEGEARNPDITFESSPQLPEEEVLSHLLFGRGLDTISPLQAAQLANAVAVLAGRGGEGIVSRLRSSVGLDDLDLATDDQGNVQVRAGKYLADNLYTDVAVGNDGRSTINLNLDINQSLRARGSIASDGKSSIGLFYERDY